MKKKLILFDFDGTIADTLPDSVDIFNRYCHNYGFKKITSEELARLKGKSARELLIEFNVSLLRLPFLIQKVQRELSPRMGKVKILPGMNNVIGRLKEKNKILGIISSNSEENIRKFLEKNHLFEFDFVHSERKIFGKDSAILKTLKKYNIHKNEAVYVGDEVRDIDAARKAGIDCVSVTWGFNKKELLKKENPRFIVDTPEELLSFLVGKEGVEPSRQ